MLFRFVVCVKRPGKRCEHCGRVSSAGSRGAEAVGDVSSSFLSARGSCVGSFVYHGLAFQLWKGGRRGATDCITLFS